MTESCNKELKSGQFLIFLRSLVLSEPGKRVDKDSDDEEEPRHSTGPALEDQVQEVKCEECFIRYRDAYHEPG